MTKAKNAKVSENIEHLVHQLETHQIELELQNEELKDAQLKMEEMRDQYMELYDSSPCGHLTLDEFGVILQANATTATMLGKSREQIEHQLFSKFINQEDQDVYYRDRREIFKKHTRQVCELRLSNENAVGIWVKLESVYIAKSNTTRSMLINVTEEKQAKETQCQLIADLRVAKDLANAANIAKSCFLSNMTHDLRTPLNSIMGMIEVLQKKELDEQTKNVSLASMSIAGNTLLQTIDDVLDLAKMELNKVVLNNCVFSLDVLVETQNSLHRYKCEQKAIAFNIKVEDDVPKLLWGDVHYLQRILSNLLSNAIKFTDIGKIELNICKCKEKIIFEVHDTGIGVADENKDKILEPFTQEDSTTTRKYGGSGLGISIVKELIGKMGGDFWFVSQQGVGSTFNFSLPLNHISQQNGQKRFSHFTVASKLELSPLNILLVDDAPSNRVLIDLFFKDQPINLDSACNGKEAVEIYCDHHQKYDLILMDLQMPEMDGYQATRKIREYEHLHHLKRTIIIALSAATLEKEVAMAIECGCDLHMAKPIKGAILLQKLKDLTLKGNESLIELNSLFTVGNKILDQQHRELVEMINSLHHAVEVQFSCELIARDKLKLVDALTAHFTTEESIFAKSSYPDVLKHREKHVEFLKKIEAYQHEIDIGNYTDKFFLYYIKDWIEQHISGLDRDYSYYIK